MVVRRKGTQRRSQHKILRSHLQCHGAYPLVPRLQPCPALRSHLPKGAVATHHPDTRLHSVLHPIGPAPATNPALPSAPSSNPLRAEGPICLQQGATVTLTCDRSAACGPSLIPVSTINSFEGQGIEPGSAIFVGQVTTSINFGGQQAFG